MWAHTEQQEELGNLLHVSSYLRGKILAFFQIRHAYVRKDTSQALFTFQSGGASLGVRLLFELKEYLNGVAVGKRVEAHGAGVLPTEKVGPYLVLRVGVVNREVLDPGGKTFIEPQMSPPLHGDLVM